MCALSINLHVSLDARYTSGDVYMMRTLVCRDLQNLGYFFSYSIDTYCRQSMIILVQGVFDREVQKTDSEFRFRKLVLWDSYSCVHTLTYFEIKPHI